MIPIRDSNPAQGVPIVTKALIAVNGLIFLWELLLGRNLPHAFLQYAVIPVRYTHPQAAAEYFGQFTSLGAALLPFLSSMFLHGGWMHLLGNMWTLWVFGDNVEARLGHVRYLLLYLAGGIVAALMHLATNFRSPVPTLGASGAIACIMGAYFRFFPRARVVAIIPPFFFLPIVLPAVIFLGAWFLLQFFSGSMSLASVGSKYGGIAWWAHIGGFLFGVGIASTAAPPKKPELTWDR
jgi:membrane associated rhomboid family serine protease